MRHTQKINPSLSRQLKTWFFSPLLYAWQNTYYDLRRYPCSALISMLVIAMSLVLPMTCYLAWKNVHHAAQQWYPSPQLTVYLDKALTDQEAQAFAEQLQESDGIQSMTYLSKEQVLKEFQAWSEFSDDIDQFKENPLPPIVILVPKKTDQTAAKIEAIRANLAQLPQVDQIRFDEGWFNRLTALTDLFRTIGSAVVLLMVATIFLVISNTVHLTLFNRRNTIEVMQLIGATEGFIMRPFLLTGALFGAASALTAIILVKGILLWLTPTVNEASLIFEIPFTLQDLQWDESLLLFIITTMMGWIAAWLATRRYLYHYTFH